MEPRLSSLIVVSKDGGWEADKPRRAAPRRDGLSGAKLTQHPVLLRGCRS